MAEAGIGADLLYVLQAERAGEDREPGQQVAFEAAKRLAAPLDRGGKAVLACRRAAVATGEYVNPLAQARGELAGGHDVGTRGREFDRERQAIQLSADVLEQPVRYLPGPWVALADPGQEEPEGVGRAQRADPVDDLAADAQRFPAGDQHVQRGVLA